MVHRPVRQLILVLEKDRALGDVVDTVTLDDDIKFGVRENVFDFFLNKFLTRTKFKSIFFWPWKCVVHKVSMVVQILLLLILNFMFCLCSTVTMC